MHFVSGHGTISARGCHRIGGHRDPNSGIEQNPSDYQLETQVARECFHSVFINNGAGGFDRIPLWFIGDVDARLMPWKVEGLEALQADHDPYQLLPDGERIAATQTVGGVVADFNADSFQDVVLIHGSFIEGGPFVEGSFGGQPPQEPNTLLINDGTARFTEVGGALAVHAGSGVIPRGAVVADFNMDSVPGFSPQLPLQPGSCAANLSPGFADIMIFNSVRNDILISDRAGGFHALMKGDAHGEQANSCGGLTLDANSDDHLDVVVFNCGALEDDALLTHFGNGKPVTLEGSDLVVQAHNSIHGLVEDLNMDGFLSQSVCCHSCRGIGSSRIGSSRIGRATESIGISYQDVRM